jgi:hypothetical protein
LRVLGDFDTRFQRIDGFAHGSAASHLSPICNLGSGRGHSGANSGGASNQSATRCG